ncbi:MAG: DUF4864 domain-containing protein [Chloroflexota bacterium]
MYSSLWENTPHPSPSLSAEDVVRLQLDALQNNDLSKNNTGIRIAFRFASPANRKATGPVDRFISLVKNPLYGPLIGFEQATLENIRFVGNMAQQRVVVHRRNGDRATFIFTLSRQRDGAEKDCWMTDGVLRVG